MKIVIDTAARTLTRSTSEESGSESTIGLFTKEAFEALSLEWVRIGWSLQYYHTFSWFGLPVLQLPEDMLRMQEVIHTVRPAVIIETGIFQGGSLVYYASLFESMGFEAMGAGRVIGIDLQIPDFVRRNVEQHPLSKRITMLEGSSTDPAIVEQVRALTGTDAPVMVILDSNHTKAHVAAELELYSPMVTPGSYIVATDGIMKDIADVPRAMAEWRFDNPFEAANEFAARHPEFVRGQPKWPAHDSVLTENITYWPGAWFKRS